MAQPSCSCRSPPGNRSTASGPRRWPRPVAATKRSTAYAQLVKEQPDNGTIQEDYADLLLAGTDKASLTAALSQWRIIASRTKPRTPRWFKAKYSVSLAQLQLGDKAGAATLLRFLLETPPGLKGTGWEEPFGKLLAKCVN